MRRTTAIGLIGCALILLSAKPASAQWSWFRWIQELSGPGDFDLNGMTVTFGCVEDRAAPRANADYGSGAVRYVFCDKSPRWRYVKRFIGVTYAQGDGTNNLDYPANREKLERVKASIYLATGAFRLHPTVDVGASGGFMRFEGTPDIVVTRYLIEPFVAVRPLAFLIDEADSDSPRDRLARAVELNAAVIVFPQGFRLSDFGAIGGPDDWSGKPETIVRLGFRVQFVF
ncbi:MAG TPA: hypothetical protein VES67_10475 [Vicinamibacterales bacterium]|nr:hypothetical protein [Vicinamibacterales bacterium]